MPVALKAILALILVPMAAFCGFGFLDSAEAGPSGAMAGRMIYGAGMIACLAAFYAVWTYKRK